MAERVRTRAVTESNIDSKFKEGQWVRVMINGQVVDARVRAVMEPYCKLELTRYVRISGKARKVYVAKISDLPLI